jgi:histidinol phosphatase-like enzyme
MITKERVEIMNNKTKKSQLVFDPKMARRLLKLNGEVKFCPYCATPISEGCDCHKNIVVDIKPYRNEDNVIVPDRSVLVFENNSAFQIDYNQMIEEAKTKREAEESEQSNLNVD